MFYLPPSPSALWFSFKLREAGRFLWTTWHSHQRWFSKAVVYSDARPRHLGLDAGRYKLTKPSEPLPLVDGLTAEGIERRAADRANASSVRLRCVFEGPSVERVPSGFGGGAYDSYDRRAHGGCDPEWRFAAGADVTIIAFFASPTPTASVQAASARGPAVWAVQAPTVPNLTAAHPPSVLVGPGPAAGPKAESGSAMGYEVGAAGVPMHAIFRGLLSSQDAHGLSPAAGDCTWGSGYR